MGPRAMAFLGFGLALAGLAFESPSLLVAGIGLALLAAGATAWVTTATRGCELHRDPGPRRIVEGDSYPLRLQLRRFLPPPGGELRDPLLSEPLPIGPLRPARIEANLRLARRGRHLLGSAVWVIRDPLGICERQLVSAPGEEVLVLPRVEPVEAASAGGDGLGVGLSASGAAAAGGREARAVEFEIDGLRRYRAGAPASRIHWPALARSGELHERRLVAGAERRPLLVLDAERPDDGDSLDRAVRATASLAVHLARQAGGCSLLLPERRLPQQLDSGLRAWADLHAQLAVVSAGGRTPAPPPGASRGATFWITAGSPERAVKRARGWGRDPHYLVTTRPCEPARPAFRVAGCAGLVIAARRSTTPARAAPRAA